MTTRRQASMERVNGRWESELRRRRSSLRELMAAHACERAIVFGSEGHSANFRYMTNFEVVHRVGHGIKLTTSFEWPSLDSEPGPLEPGVTICIGPGIYVNGAGNMKLEDHLVVTEAGYELLANAQRGFACDR
jgi:Metallopeptidase family M24